jgi:phosphatidate cytidylyltransferase
MNLLTAELKTRIVTALVLAVVVIATLATGSTALWALLVLMFCLAAGWECLRLIPNLSFGAKALSWVLIFGGLVFLAFALFDKRFANSDPLISKALTGLLLLASAFWLFVVPLQVQSHKIAIHSWWARLTVPLLICSAWFAAVVLQRSGTALLVAVVTTTVVADVSAYFVGRTLGRVKLAPSISPGKTREGAIGGVVAASLWVALLAWYLGLVADVLEVLLAALAGAFLGVFAVLGDLWESLLKRLGGVKDSSRLLPGHGGVLDRIDAQLAVLPLATLLLTLVKSLW